METSQTITEGKIPRNRPLVYVMTDVVGSTALWLQDDEGMDACLELVDGIVANISKVNHGALIGDRGEGDSHFLVFDSVEHAVLAAVQLGLELRNEPLLKAIELRTAIHIGESNYRSGNHYGPEVNKCARMRAAAGAGQILVSEVIRLLCPLSTGLAFKSLGVHQLRGIPQREELFQVVFPGLPTEFPPLRASLTGSNNLPVFLTSFLGRHEDIQQVSEHLSTQRMTTITGPGGIGKTRLAVEVAQRSLHKFDGGVWFVDLTTATSEAAVISAMCAGFPASEVNDEQALVRAFLAEQALLVIDNCEQVATECRAVVRRLLGACPILRILATSRMALQLPGEKIYHLGSLDVSIAGKSGDAVELFLDRTNEFHLRADLRESSLGDIAALCQKVDCLPLAIEIVSKWTDLLTVREISDRLDEFLEKELESDQSKPYSRTIAATIESSCELLSRPARDLLARLTVFSSAWSIEAAKEICIADNVTQEDVERAMKELINLSLVFAGSVLAGQRRFRMLQTTSQVIRRQVIQYPQDLLDRFIRFMALKIEAARQLGQNGQETKAYSMIEGEYDSFVRALELSIENDPVKCLEMSECLRDHWLRSSRIRDGKHWFERIAMLESLESKDRVVALSSLSSFCIRLDELNEAQIALKSAEELLRDEGGFQWARIIGNQGAVWHRLGKMEEARDAFAACREVFHNLHRLPEEGLALINLGVCKMRLGEPLADCIDLFWQSARCGAEAGSPSMQGNAYSSLAEAYSLLGEHEKALEFCEQSLLFYQQGVWLVQTAWTLVSVSNLLFNVGAVAESALVWHASYRLESLANTHFTPRQLDILTRLHHSYPKDLVFEHWPVWEATCETATSDELIVLTLEAIVASRSK